MNCDACGSDFTPGAIVWGARCGDCIAAAIELQLLRPLLGRGERKPLRRAPAPEVLVPERQERAA